MDTKVKAFLQQKQDEKDAALLKDKQRLLKCLNLFDKVEVEKDDGYDTSVYNHETGKYIFYKYVFPEITDEEYKKLLNHDPNREVEHESNGEDGLFVIASIELALCVLAGVICLIVAGTADYGGGMIAMSGAIAILVGLVQFWTVKVFTNISRKATAIYKSLQKREE